MTAIIKEVNYTPEQTEEVKRLYAEGTTTEAIATAMGKSVRSIVAKLSREKVYKKAEYKTKTGEPVISKEQYVADIAGCLGCEADDLGGLEKANKETLKRILAGLKTNLDITEEEF